MKINKKLIWDYAFTEEELNTESFRQWYIARVLSRGNLQDLKDVGFDEIYRYLGCIQIPNQLRQFWEWYFSLPQQKQKYGHINRKPETYFKHPLASRFIQR